MKPVNPCGSRAFGIFRCAAVIFFFGGRRAAARQSVMLSIRAVLSAGCQSVTLQVMPCRCRAVTLQVTMSLSPIFRNSLYNEGKCSILALKNALSLVALGLRAIAIAEKKRRENYTVKDVEIVEKSLALS